MNNIFSKILCSVTIGLMVSIAAIASSNPDSTKLLAANATSTAITAMVVKEANMLYPVALQSGMDKSIEYVQKFSNKKRSYLIGTWQKGKQLFPTVVAVLKKYGLPQELKVLIALESDFNANAVSRAGAVGYWQIMDEAAREYGLKTGGNKKDERRNLAKSTVAAAKYLKDRCRNLNNDLLLTVASYNCGVGGVRNAMRKSGKSNPDFWDIKKYLPSETKSYVMNFIALNVVFNNYDKFVANKMVFGPENIEVPLTMDAAILHGSVTD